MEEIEKRYAQMHVKEFNNIKQNFENHNNSNDSDSQIPTLTAGPMDFKNVPNINKFIDTSSSASTMGSDKEFCGKTDQENPYKSIRFADHQRDTPPRAQELRHNQDVRLVNPKALIPINSERPLPNPYQNTMSSAKPKVSPKPQIYSNQNMNTFSPKSKLSQQFNFNEYENKSLNIDTKIGRPYLDETYGTVFDSVENKNEISLRNQLAKVIQRPPRSPSLEPSKLKLPPNRDIGPMSPRIRSPIPHHHVSAEKLIATELLRTSRSPTPTKKRTNQLSSSHQKLELNIDYPDNVNVQINEKKSPSPIVTRKPPISRISEQQRSNQTSPNYETRNQMLPLIGSQEKLIGNTIINSTVMRTPTPNSVLQNAELSPLRPHSSRSSTPVDLRNPHSPKTQSPQKEEMRRNVEAYYWKEIKKLKEQENMDLYYYQMQMMPFGYTEDPIHYRRSRSSSPSSQRNGRRSLSLPRESKSQMVHVEINDNYGRFQPTPIPEGRAVVNVNYPPEIYYQQNFKRNAPERRTIDTVPRTNGNTIYRPIFKRGSLTTPVREFVVDDQQHKKVSFNSGREKPVWPTKNGYTQSPPQRKLDTRHESLDDDVFLPNPQHTSKLIVDGKEIYGYTNRPHGNHISRRPQDPPHYQNANFYKQIHQEPIYNQRSNSIDTTRIPVGLAKYNSMQLVEPIYGQNQRVSRRMSFDNSQGYLLNPQMQQNVNYNMPRRQIYIKDEIYGYFGGYAPPNEQQAVYSSRQNVAEPTYGYSRGGPKQVIVKDKVCDIYGQIHDRDSPSLNIRKSGVMLGQLQPAQSAYSNAPNQNFVRNSRLTSSANDMYRRYQNVDPRYSNNVIYNRYPVQSDGAPSRPLPPVPTDKKVYYRPTIDSVPQFSDENKANSVGKSKKRGIFGNVSQSTADNAQTKNSKLERLILLEQLHLLKQQQKLEINKCQWKQSRGNTLDKYQELRKNCLETKSTEDLSICDLKKVILLEELNLLKLKIKYEINVK